VRHQQVFAVHQAGACLIAIIGPLHLPFCNARP
jgi:hypothetical protein